ncbi:MAG: DEAD/DEAH box helicase [Nannocystaceae bacterium]|nr:DEAD/DEAH box helicase [Nannocystaceae bacterium]
MEAQATDRAVRIGQTQPVTVYRLVCTGTVEERVIAMQERKRALADAIAQGAESRSTDGLRLAPEDLQRLLAPLDA